MTQHDDLSRPRSNALERIMPALVLIAIGAIFFLNNLHIIYFQDIWRFWPLVLIAVGLAKLVDGASDGRAGGAILLVVAGGLFLANNFGYLDLNWHTFWPLILIGIGILMLLDRTVLKIPFPRPHRSYENGFMRENVVFGGGKRKMRGQEFRGGKFEAVFGGFEIDLRDSYITGDSATLEVDAVFGGAEIKIPCDWLAVIQGTGMFGAFEDKTTQPHPAEVPNPKRLIVRGSAVFAGVEVKN
ncbi:MAG TPA: DUF5668 domain-containing protein [Candidatus Limnocylindrales bacterium]|nr:DUF5668 domain-containing protein [Candidatus Limnocylindrales bacterium]